MDRKKEIDRKRKEANRLLIERMRDGDALQFSAEMTYFPPRPLIVKNKKDIEKLYGKKENLTKQESIQDD